MVYIGRFSPPHNGHIETIKQALTLAKTVIVLIGSANQPRTIKNPFTWEERADMIKDCFPNVISAEREAFIFKPIEDTIYNDQQWLMNVQEVVDKEVKLRTKPGKEPTIGMTGYDKDESSYYIKSFPQWKTVPAKKIELVSTLSATNVRDAYFEHGMIPNTDYVPEPVATCLRGFQRKDEYTTLVNEYNYIKQYKARWDNSPYPPTFVTVDAVVITLGHVLAVRRRAAPGQGLLALPGGFLDHDERIVDGVIRELREETKLKVPEMILRKGIQDKEVFDHPRRSLRGRTITHATLIYLEPTDQGLPKVKGGSDARKAEWIPLNQALTMGDQWFEDHLMIIKHFLGEL